MAQCQKCGREVKNENMVFIFEKYVGRDCAARMLGVQYLPFWFTKDYEKEKLTFEKNKEAFILAFEKSREITRQTWFLHCKLASAYLSAREREKEFEIDFLYSIAQQLGFLNLNTDILKYGSFEDAENNWNLADGSFPYIHKEPSEIHDLSFKQQKILKKILP